MICKSALFTVCYTGGSRGRRGSAGGLASAVAEAGGRWFGQPGHCDVTQGRRDAGAMARNAPP